MRIVNTVSQEERAKRSNHKEKDPKDKVFNICYRSMAFAFDHSLVYCFPNIFQVNRMFLRPYS